MGLMVVWQQWFRRSPQGLCFVLLLGGLMGLSACQRNAPPTEPTPPPNPENRLIVENALLEQSDANGKILWKLQAEKAVYSQDRKRATLTNLVGNLYEGDRVILSLQAKQGEVINDGERIILEKGVLVTDNRHDAVFETTKAEWQPQQYVLTIQQALTAKYPNGKLTAKQGQYFIDRQELALTEQVNIQTINPPLQLQGTKLLWQIKTDKIVAKTGLTVQRYTKDKVTARLQAQQGEADLKAQTVVVRGNVLLNNLDPAVQFASGAAQWNLKSGLITGTETVQLTQTQDKIQFRAAQGQFNLNTQQASLTGSVQGTGEDPPAKLSTSRLDWNLQTEILTAVGQVVYQQANPNIKLVGDRAVGKLNQDQLVVSGTKQKQVTTEIIPQ